MAIPVEYGVPTDRCGLQIRMGIEKGFFRDVGIDLSLRIVYGGPEIVSEFDTGRLKIGELGRPPGLTAFAKGARFKIVGSSVRRGAAQYFVVHPRFSDWRDLQGTQLGAPSRGSCSDFYMRTVLAHHAIDPEHDVTIVGLGSRYPQILALLETYELDGAIISEPHVTMGEDSGLFNVWLGLNSLNLVPRMQWSIAVANNEALRKEATLAAAILEGCRRSYRYAAQNRDEWANFGARHYGITQKAMARLINRELNDLHFDCEIDIDGLEAAMALQRKLGTLTKPLQLGDVVDERFTPISSAVR